MPKQKLLLLPVLILIASCQNSAGLTDTACSWVRPIYTNKADRAVMEDELAQQLAVHNRLWKARCMK